MNFTSQDIAIIEKALKSAMHTEGDVNRKHDYREVLLKLEDSAQQALRLNPVPIAGSIDGIRYDYDDSSDML
jgi:hypothetical protein